MTRNHSVEPSGRVANLQALRGVAVMMVVLFHCAAAERKYAGDTILPALLRIGESGVDLFFVISGFVMVMVTRGKFGRTREAGWFLYSRATRIYPVYWVYVGLAAAVYLAQPAWVNASQGHQVDLLRSFLLLPQEQLPVLLVAWSLVHEMYFYLLFALFVLAPENRLPRLLIAWAAIVAISGLTWWHPGVTPWARIAAHPLTLEFVAGAFAALWLPKTSGRPSPARLWGGVALSLIGLVAAYECGVLDMPALPRAAVMASIYGVLVYCAVALEQRCAQRARGWLVRLGDASYTIYLAHVLVLSAVGRIWLRAGVSPEPWDNLLWAAMMLVAVVGYGYLGYRWIERPLVDYFHRLRRRLREVNREAASA